MFNLYIMFLGLDFKSDIMNILMYFVFICLIFGFVLGYLKEESESEDNNNIENNTLDKDFNQDIVDETNNYEDNIADEEVKNEYDKDEELLDIPTFLSRQAN